MQAPLKVNASLVLSCCHLSKQRYNVEARKQLAEAPSNDRWNYHAGNSCNTRVPLFVRWPMPMKHALFAEEEDATGLGPLVWESMERPTGQVLIGVLGEKKRWKI